MVRAAAAGLAAWFSAVLADIGARLPLPGACTHARPPGPALELRYQSGVLTSGAYGAEAGDTAAGAFETQSVIERIAVLGLPGGPSGWQVRSLTSSCGTITPWLHAIDCMRLCAVGLCARASDGGVFPVQVSLVSSGGAFDSAPGPLHLKPGAPATALVVRKPNLSLASPWTLEFVQQQTS